MSILARIFRHRCYYITQEGLDRLLRRLYIAIGFISARSVFYDLLDTLILRTFARRSKNEDRLQSSTAVNISYKLPKYSLRLQIAHHVTHTSDKDETILATVNAPAILGEDDRFHE